MQTPVGVRFSHPTHSIVMPGLVPGSHGLREGGTQRRFRTVRRRTRLNPVPADGATGFAAPGLAPPRGRYRPHRRVQILRAWRWPS